MRTLSGALLGLLAIFAVSSAVSSSEASAASKHDEVVTQAVLEAGYSAMHEVVGSWPRLEASLSRLNDRFAVECPHVGEGSPQTELEQRMSYEVAGALWAAGYHTDAPIIHKFIRAISGLSIANRSLDRRMHRFVNGLREMMALPIPNICADVRAWTASGYRVVPSDTLQFDDHVEAINVDIPSPKLADPYLTPADRGLVPKLERLVARFGELEISTGQQYWNMLLETLSVPQ